MKNLLVLALFLIPLSCFAPYLPNDAERDIKAQEAYYNAKLRHDLVWAVGWVESRHRPYEYLERTKAAGLLQICPIMIEDLVSRGHNFTLADRFDSAKSVEMFWIVQKQYTPNMNISAIVRKWGAGAGRMYCKGANRYYREVMKKLHR